MPYILLLVLTIVFSVRADGLPPLFDTDDYYSCQNQNGVYCKVDIDLEVHNETSRLAQEIKMSLDRKYKFNWSTLHRMVCVPRDISQNNTIGYITHLSERKLEDFNVSLTVANLECNEDRHFRPYDFLLIALLVVYLLMVYESTKYDLQTDNPKTAVSKYDKWLKIFSIRQNWRKIISKNTNIDYQNLKSLQGLRFFNTILIVTCHTKLCHLLLFIENPKEYEESLSYPLHLISNQLDLFIVQTYFMTSTFLLTNQVLELYKNTGTFSLKSCLNLYINRIIRLWPTSTIMVLMALVGLKIFPKGTPVVHVINMSWRGCTTNWWGTMFQMNFLYDPTQMCNPGSWYLSVDSLLYASTLLLMYLHLAHKMNLRKLLSVAFVFFSAIYSYDIYINDMDAIYKVSPESIRTLIESPAFYHLYVNPFASWSTSIVGILMGYVYFHNKHKDIQLNKIQQVIWLFLFLGLPTLSVYLCFLDVRGVNRALLGPLLKPIFALGFGLGVLGMSKGYGGPIKRILEADLVVKLSNFTYCTYQYHFFLVVLLHGTKRSLYRYSLPYLLWNCVQDVLLSYSAGGFMALAFEYPGLTLQKMYVPQLKRTNKESREKE
ncbi:hypothetical protein GWI33_013972 [Rhynchophorus ferrugineus]|uniref:Acyltransferase 3 domain-containing protein n=1 Tax=Rhynchophorus ferrugineus TaxID=354439 RepID=A0A834I737_RHYFE|nr:hypothetical protein GWI33_013972 [Rhynchophorus ferrugineus]